MLLWLIVLSQGQMLFTPFFIYSLLPWYMARCYYGQVIRYKENNPNDIKKNKPYIVVPYMKGLNKSCKNMCRKHGIEMFFKGGNTIKELLVHPKDKDYILQKSGVIYRYTCGRVDCEEEYKKDSENIWELHHLYMATLTSQVMRYL